MELKYASRSARAYPRQVLIAPSGIEISFFGNNAPAAAVLIAPSGIEIVFELEYTNRYVVLIAPSGIEIRFPGLLFLNPMF